MNSTPHIDIQDKLSELCRKCPSIDLDVRVLHANDEVLVATVYCRNERLCSDLHAYLSRTKEVNER